jgi:ribosomal protein S18 acetylase RimI-like enzyme
VTLRPYQDADRDALYEICHRTGLAGKDATGVIEDRRLLGDLFAVPYAELEPDLVTIADLDGEAVGYVVGTADTAAFEARCEAEWYPAKRVERPEGSGGDAIDALFIALFHNTGHHADPELLADYPAHFHIDLLPVLQGQGVGRRMLEAFCAAVVAKGAGGVHFGVNAANESALGFYRHLGFDELRADSHTILMGKRFGA